jgi:hypothetical protein
MNLLEETIDVLKRHGKKPTDVLAVGSFDGKYSCTWAEFKKIANFDYDNGFGSQEISSDLTVIGDGWWLERYEYDGSETWVFKPTTDHL